MGIGLALVKELVMLQKWEISVQSRNKGGTKFIITIPVEESNGEEKQHYSLVEEEMKETGVSDFSPGGRAEPRYETVAEEAEKLDENNPTEKKPSILIVEDSPDVRKDISDLLNPEYKVIQCKDSESGIKSEESWISRFDFKRYYDAWYGRSGVL